MKIIFYEIQGWEVPMLKKKLNKHNLTFYQEPLTESNISTAKNADAISIFIYSTLTSHVLTHLPKLKIIATRSTGYDHIDIQACKKRKICVTNVPSYGENTVAEHTFALILTLSRNIHKSYLRTLRNDFTIEGLKGFDLMGKTLGVIGVGKIGKHVIRIASGFGMNVLAVDPHPDKAFAKELNFKYVTFNESLKKSDILTLHIPYTKENHHLINKKTLSIMKKGSILINTSRGLLVDNNALIEALDKKILVGLGIDVIEGEELIKEEKQLLYDSHKTKKLAELIKDHILIAKDNVVFTPHIAFYSQEALERIIEKTIENLLAYPKGKVGQECIVSGELFGRFQDWKSKKSAQQLKNEMKKGWESKSDKIR